jgi:hypothetical protein
MEYKGTLSKMASENTIPVNYSLFIDNRQVEMNKFIGKKLEVEFLGEIFCIKCGRKTNKSFSQGFCYPCFLSAPETEDCVMRPELCRAHENIARDMEFAQNHCLIDHFVYLSRTNAIKVGVTRHTQIPTRWIDQGAVEAIKLARTPNRYTAGLVEVALKNFLPDKTNWRNMLTGKITDNRSLAEVKSLMHNKLNDDLKPYFLNDESLSVNIVYPQLEVPGKVISVDLEKILRIEGVLTGIKGQYLIFDNFNVINIRKYGGYKVLLKC